MACHTDIAAQLKNATNLHGKLMHDNPSLACRDCHSEHRGANAQLTTIDSTTFPHEAVGFSLIGHQRTAAGLPFTCDDCHHGDITSFAPDLCQTCHSQIDISFTQAHIVAFGTNCLACHDGVDRYGKNFNHNNFSFKLTGKHTTVICTDCHTNSPRNVVDLQSLPQNCYTCHQKVEPHQGKFGTDCASCHSTDAWKPAKFDHNLANFKLVGSHVNVKCEQCHANNEFKGTPSDCYSCHKKDDHHNGQFGTDCSGCHQPTKWADATFDHSKSNFPLTGSHINVACAQCHTNGVFKGLSTACASCHADPGWHQGAFGSNCAACHNTINWSNAQFNGQHPSFGEDRSGIHHGGATCKTCHTINVFDATCIACHKNGKPGDGGGGGGGEGGG
jgi:hypothetical protein